MGTVKEPQADKFLGSLLDRIRQWFWEAALVPALAPARRFLEASWFRAALASWLAGVVAVSWVRLGNQAWRSPVAWGFAVVGALLIALIAHLRRNVRAGILVARPCQPGGDGADGEILQTKFMHALQDSAPRSGWRVEASDLVVNIDDASQRDRLVAAARSGGLPVALGANVTLSDGEFAVYWAVLPAAAGAGTVAIHGLRGQGTVDVSLGLENLRRFKTTTAEEVAQVARLAAGITLLSCDKPNMALDVFEQVRPPIYLSVLYQAFCALRLRQWARARELASSAAALEYRTTPLALKFIAEVQLALIDEAAATATELARAPQEGTTLEPDDPQIAVARVTAVAQSMVITLARATDELAVAFRNAELEIQKANRIYEVTEEEMRGRFALKTDVEEAHAHLDRALALLADPGGRAMDPATKDRLEGELLAVRSRALALNGRSDLAADDAQRAEQLLPGPGEGTDSWKDLLIAYALIDDESGTVRILDIILPWLDEPQVTLWRAGYDLGAMADRTEVAARLRMTNGQRRVPHDEATIHATAAMAAAHGGDYDRGRELASEAEQGLRVDPRDASSWAQLLLAYAAIGDEPELRRLWEKVAAISDDVASWIPTWAPAEPDRREAAIQSATRHRKARM